MFLLMDQPRDQEQAALGDGMTSPWSQRTVEKARVLLVGNTPRFTITMQDTDPIPLPSATTLVSYVLVL